MSLELGLLVFQVILVGFVAAFLEAIAPGLPAFTELPEQRALAQGTLQPIEDAHLF
jgi:hypothetical protein